ncbi:SMI1/KNR4 family protein [Streptomyces sp. TRM66268-LWL]|uniref:SMI1/KNR4 family protein n=1 Tax=Streptomyces polyasparticus TaxID=2767826 RepID=A0ABR7SVD1_9ACTN|nr:SMI1/KNR4 family protein [Streptomyces polyasparticus]
MSAGGTVCELRRTDDGWWWAGDNEYGRRDLLHLPFPHPDDYAAAEDELGLREPRMEDYADESAYDRAWKAWDDEYGELQDRKTAGAVIAQEHGCGFSTLLALTGPLAGTMWWDGRATCDRILPLSLEHGSGARPVTFDEWLDHDSWNLLPPGWGQQDLRPDRRQQT